MMGVFRRKQMNAKQTYRHKVKSIFAATGTSAVIKNSSLNQNIPKLGQFNPLRIDSVQ